MKQSTIDETTNFLIKLQYYLGEIGYKLLCFNRGFKSSDPLFVRMKEVRAVIRYFSANDYTTREDQAMLQYMDFFEARYKLNSLPLVNFFNRVTIVQDTLTLGFFDNRFVRITGDIMTGPLVNLMTITHEDGTEPKHSVNLQQLQATAATLQPLDATLTALSALNTTPGIVVQTGTDTFIKRTLIGTAGQITITNANGVAANPDISLTATGVTAGTYNTVTVDTFGRVTTAINTAYDNYVSWGLSVNGSAADSITAGQNLNINAGSNISLLYIPATNTLDISSAIDSSTFVTGGSWNAGTGDLTLTRAAGNVNINLDGRYDNYSSWILQANGGSASSITSGATVNFVAGSNISLSKVGNAITITAASSAETDPTVPSWVKGITEVQITNWDTAFSWGNHTGLYVPLARTVTAGAGLTGGGALSSDIAISHADTSSQTSVNNSNGTVIQDVTLDTYGHVTGLTSIDLDTRYATASSSGNYVHKDSGFGGARFAVKTVPIGNWDMNYSVAGATSVSVPHGLGAEWVNIKKISVMIRNDDNDALVNLETSNQSGEVFGSCIAGSTNIVLTLNTAVAVSNAFDSTTYDGTGFSRGYVTIWWDGVIP